ncbi:MAG: HEAT repeat domain-containing protein [Anaerolineae bacterium]|nr:HEAT repeat domain-containing protein [Anaerolineae bacterium]
MAMIDMDDAISQTQKNERALELLRDPEAAFTAELVRGLSDLSGTHLDTFLGMWATMPTERRRSLITRLVETAETNFEFDYTTIITAALNDPDMDVRKTAIDGIFEESSHSTIRKLMTLAQEDPFFEVRAAAVSALGPFVLQGELGKLPATFNTRLQDTVLALYRNPNEALDVRRRALEAIANCGRDGVQELIRESYYADELLMRVSAVFAMGRSCDEVWEPHILEELDSEYPEMRYEAARAAGELELRKSLPRLIEMAYEDDREVQEMAVWALGEIGNKQARSVLTQLAALAEESDDDELLDVITEAQSAATLAGEDVLPLFDFGDLDDDSDEYDDEYGSDDDDDDNYDPFDDML